MKADDYIDYLKRLTDEVDDDKKPLAEDAHKLALSLLHTLDKCKISSAFFALPILMQTVELTIHSYRHGAEEQLLDPEEFIWFTAIRDSVKQCLIDLDFMLEEGKNQ